MYFSVCTISVYWVKRLNVSQEKGLNSLSNVLELIEVLLQKVQHTVDSVLICLGNARSSATYDPLFIHIFIKCVSLKD